ncbi:hypothetical protein E5675_15070 [Sphingopyxis sp. PAMC25046]|uniref:hypothetical protein n=1 Tax=Sphingopyxis sp. PAMC25046 TaxID=2565556 RepID=UPI00109D8C49|nr:hypothetical protein [Sphingopyxis sp. PAMC25046]QCB55620.1 hypothetical protein E5675_15070 [Sphingopyxis sp. PAMC25046]
MARFLGRAGWAAAVAICAASPVTRAEPAPAPAIDPGRYDTPWGAGAMRMNGSTAILTLDDGSVFWGSLGNGGRSWDGRWVRAPRSARPDRAHRPCSDARGPVPSSFPVPSGVYWGRFTAHSVRSTGNRALVLNWSNCAETPTGSANRFNIVEQAPRPYTEAAPPSRAVPSLPYDGPCNSIRARAVATIAPCNLDFARPFRLTLQRAMQKPVGRITFTPLVDDPVAVLAAVRSNTVLPVHPTAREVYQVVRGDKLHMRGSWADVTPPATICEHDFWIVNVIDGNGQRHSGNGVVVMSCGPHRLGREGPVATPALEPVQQRRDKGK